MTTGKKGYSDKKFFQPSVKSNIVKKMISERGISQKTLARYLNCTQASLRNKFSRDSFSLYDFIIICYACECPLSIVPFDSESIEIAKECFEDIEDSILSALDEEPKDLYNASHDALDTLENALDNLGFLDIVFEFTPENILSEEECERLNNIKESNSTEKLDRIMGSLTDSEQLTFYKLLEEQQKNKDKDNS